MTEETNNVSTEAKTETREDTLAFVGETLKNKRLGASISMTHVEKELNIRLHYLKALESGDWSKMPEEVYALGFLRQYAKYLKCDLNASIEKLKSNDYTLNKPVTFPDPPIAPNRKWMIVSLVALVVLFIAFNVIKQQTSSPLPSEIMQKNAQHVLDSQTKDQPQNITEGVELKAAPIIQETTPKTVDIKPTIEKISSQEATSPTIPSKIHNTPETSSIKATSKLPEKVQLSSNKTAALTHTYTCIAKASDVWLQVYQQSNKDKPLREALLKQGQGFSVTAKQPIFITTGRPLALEISMDGQVVVEVGTMAKVNHFISHFVLPKPR